MSWTPVQSRNSQTARLFDDTNLNWVPEIPMNILFIKAQQNWLNHKLQTRGFVFLNEAYEALGLAWTTEGQLLGWILEDGKAIEIEIHPAIEILGSLSDGNTVELEIHPETNPTDGNVNFELDFNTHTLILNRI